MIIEVLVGCLNKDSFGEPARSLDYNKQIISMVTDYNKDSIIDRIITVLRQVYKIVRLRRCTLDNYVQVINDIESSNFGANYVVFQMCDGTEIDGYPGMSVVLELERRKIRFTGASSYFYDITTSKSVMKRALLDLGVSTSPFVDVYNDESIYQAEQIMPYPMIIKPSISYASLGINSDSILHSRADAVKKIARRISHINGEGRSEYIIERFLDGREFTVLILGGGKNTQYEAYAVERSFDPNLGIFERILDFEVYWSAELSSMNDVERRNIVPVCGGSQRAAQLPVRYINIDDECLNRRVTDLSIAAYRALCGTGYGRVDIRSDSNGNLYALEVNAQPSFSICDEETSIGNILKLKNIDPRLFIKRMLKT